MTFKSSKTEKQSFVGHDQGIQGDVAITRVDALPEGLVLANTDDKGYLVVAHSETGHCHLVQEKTATLYEDPSNPMMAFLVVDDVADLEHHRSFDEHTTVGFDKGIYRINRQQEFTPEGLRRVAD